MQKCGKKLPELFFLLVPLKATVTAWSATPTTVATFSSSFRLDRALGLGVSGIPFLLLTSPWSK